MTVSGVVAVASEALTRARGGLWVTAAREARTLAAPQRTALTAAAALLVVNRMASLCIPMVGKLAVDAITARGHTGTLVPIVALAAAAAVVQAGSGLGLGRVMGATAGRAVGAIRRDIQARAIRLPLNTLHCIPPGRLVTSVTSDADQLGTVLAVGVVPLASSVLTAAGALVLLASVSRLAVVLVVPGMVVAAADSITRRGLCR
jgi:ABC-type multidrug transport system fused ATPase/permease subunit